MEPHGEIRPAQPARAEDASLLSPRGDDYARMGAFGAGMVRGHEPVEAREVRPADHFHAEEAGGEQNGVDRPTVTRASTRRLPGWPNRRKRLVALPCRRLPVGFGEVLRSG